MKIKILSTSLMTLFLFTQVAIATTDYVSDNEGIDDNNSCDLEDPLSSWATQFYDTYKTSCDLTKGDRRGQLRRKCECLKKEGASNILLNGIMNDEQKLQENEKNFYEQREKLRKEYKDRFFSVYEQVTIKEGLQAKVLGLELDFSKNESVVGCSPKNLSKKVKEFTNHNKGEQLKALSELKSEEFKKLDAELKRLVKIGKIKKNEIPYIKANGYKHAEIDKSLTSTLRAIDRNILELTRKNSCLSAIEMFRDEVTINKFKAMEDAFADNPSMLERLKKVKTDLGIGTKQVVNLGEKFDHQKVVKNFDFIVGQLSPLSTVLTTGMFNAGLQAIGVPALQACEKSYSEMKALTEAYELKMVGNGESLTSEERTNQCDAGDPLCDQFEDRNKLLLEEVQKNYTKNDENDSCITKAEFETFKGMPGQKLLESFRRNWWNSDKYLDVAGVDENDGELEKQQVEFLRSNPILAKLSANKETRSKLGKAMRKMAKELENIVPDGPEAFKAYMRFMKEDVQKIVKDNKEVLMSNDAYICDGLARNFTAIDLSNDVPEINESGNPNASPIDQLEIEMSKCQKRNIQEASTTNLAASLKLDPLFTLGMNSDKQKDLEDEFEELKKNVCQGWEKVKKSCDGDTEVCRKKFLGASNDPKVAKFHDVFTSSGAKSVLSSTDVKTIAAFTNESKQDHTYIKKWEEEVGSKMDKSVLARRGKEHHFFRSQQSNMDFVSKTKVVVPDLGDMGSRSDVNNETKTQLGQNEKSSQGQQVPDWAKEEKFVDASKFSQAKVPQDLVPGFNALPPIDQKEALKEVRNFVANQPSSPFELDDVDDEIQKIDKKIIEDYKSNKNVVKDENVNNDNKDKVKFAGAANGGVFKPSQNVNSGSNFSFTPYIANSDNTYVNKSGKINKLDKVNKAYNDAKLQVHDKNNVDRNIASVGEVKVNLQDKLINFESVPGLLIDEAVPLVPDTHDNYVAMKGDHSKLITYLESNFDKMDIKGTKVIKVQDPQESPHAYLLFYVSQNASGEFSVRPIKRQSTLNDLKNNLAQ